MNHTQTNITLPPQLTNYLIGSNLLVNLGKIKELTQKNFTSFLLLSDTTTFKLYGDKVVSALENFGKPIITSLVTPGEKHKSLPEISNLVRPYFESGLDRNACLVALGGGVVTDLGGFIASILLRGIGCIYIPTTLLGQIDAAIGGKTGVDFHLPGNLMLKNMIGTIRQPSLVISDTDTLVTLPMTEILNGLGEMAKYWVGWGIPTMDQLRLIKNSLASTPGVEHDKLREIILICQKIKLSLVQQDPFETKGARQKLNLGHTIGHTIEAASDGKLSHGQAVSIGLVAAAKLSAAKNLLPKEKCEKIIHQLEELGLPTSIKGIDKKKILTALKLDKKGGKFVLIEDIGKLKTGVEVDSKLIEKVISEVII